MKHVEGNQAQELDKLKGETVGDTESKAAKTVENVDPNQEPQNETKDNAGNKAVENGEDVD